MYIFNTIARPAPTTRSGFTLIELLVVIAIIGLLSSVVLASLNTARAKARDVRRLSDMQQIRTALELYHGIHGRYPGMTQDYGEAPNCGGWDSSDADEDGDGRPFIEPLIDAEAMPQVPLDPSDSPGPEGDSCGNYAYYRYNASHSTNYGCGGQPFYVLGVRDMETTERPHPDSPGWQCANRNWQNEFDWVIGEFE